MEEMKSNVNNQILYPDKKIMEFFLMVGQRVDIFNTVMINTVSGIQDKRYLSMNNIRCLSLISEYMATAGHEEEMKEFLDMIHDQTSGTIYMMIAEWVLKIRGEKKQNEYTKQTIKLYQSKLGTKKEISPSEMPIIPQSILPDRQKQNEGIIIHEAFQERIEQCRQVDEIEEQTKKHIFVKQDNSDEINNFKNKL